MLDAEELVQWENGKSVNGIAASQGIRIRRHCRPTASLKEIEEEMGAPRNILEKIIWDKEIEVAEVCSCNLLMINVCMYVSGKSSDRAQPSTHPNGQLTWEPFNMLDAI